MDSLNKILNFLIVLTVVAIAGSFFYFNSLKKQIQSVRKVDVSEAEVDKTVNKYIQQINSQNETNRLKMEIALAEARKKIIADREAEKLKAEKKAAEVPLKQQVWTAEKSKDVAKTLPAKQKKSSDEDEYSEDINVSEMSPEEKKQYAKEYIENARRGGYEIKLDENLEVIEATPIKRKPSQQSERPVDEFNTD